MAARKPAQSFAPGEGPTDADLLADATGAAPEAVCPPHRWYEVPMAPPMAADVLGRPPFTIADLCRELVWPDGTAVGLVEGAGGRARPWPTTATPSTSRSRSGADAVVLVADAGLGTINAVRLAAPPLRAVAPVTVVLNRYDGADELHRRNRAWLTGRAGLAVVDSVAALVARIT